jgi:predicted TIM-barrel fold metal-dependent hydrolase
MVERLAQREARKRTKTSFIDCDIHNIVPSVDVLEPYLPARWRRHVESFGMRQHHGFASGIPYPKASPGGGSRVDAWPPSGLPPGADLDFMREQHLDVLDVECGILNCLYPKVGEQLNDELGAALACATNDWQIAEWLEKEPRLRASIVVPYENAEFSAAEIDRVADHPGFVQVVLLPRTKEPLGKRRYWKIYEAAERHNLPIGIHFAGLGGNPITSSGWPSYYIEDHTVMSMAFQSQVISLVCEGVFERFPNLRVVLLEGGLAWIPSLMWRLDKHWKRLRDEVPHLKRPPSEYIREHMRATTQPMEEPPDPKQLLQVFEHLGSDEMLMFATDYPHWDYDDPDRAFSVRLPSDMKEKIFSENARALYAL